MKKKIVSIMMTGILAAGMLAGCGGSKPADSSAQPAAEPAAEGEAAGEAEAVDYGSGEIKIWVAENVVDFTKEQCDAFFAEHADMAGYTVTVEPVGEGDAAGNVITDVEGGADIYGFAQDQLARLVAAGALTPIAGDEQTLISGWNDAASINSATVGGTLYAYPLTSDNGYFLYYDKSVVTDPTSLEAIIADCEAAGKGFYMEINSGWYQTAFFFGAGADLTYETDDAGNFTACNAGYATEEGVAAMKAMINLHKSKAFNNGSSISNAANCAAIVDGTWDSGAAKDLFGENYACAKLPEFTVDGTTYQMSGFGGFKLMGVKPQTDAGKLQVCKALAQYLSSEAVQIARYNAVGWGPSNLNAQQDEAVKADEALTALSEQLQYTIPQGQYPGDYWTLATSLGDSIISGDYDNADDAALMAALQDFQATCEGYAK